MFHTQTAVASLTAYRQTRVRLEGRPPRELRRIEQDGGNLRPTFVVALLTCHIVANKATPQEPSLIFSSSVESARSCSSIDCSSLNVSSNSSKRDKPSSSTSERRTNRPLTEGYSKEQPWHNMQAYRASEEWSDVRRPKDRSRAMSKGIRAFEEAMVEASPETEDRESDERRQSLSKKREAFNKDLDDFLGEQAS